MVGGNAFTGGGKGGTQTVGCHQYHSPRLASPAIPRAARSPDTGAVPAAAGAAPAAAGAPGAAATVNGVATAVASPFPGICRSVLLVMGDREGVGECELSANQEVGEQESCMPSPPKPRKPCNIKSTLTQAAVGGNA